MARPREFDEEEVLDRALDVFWAKGYESTSIHDLMAATGLAKGSVYKGFGDKKSLFLRTLNRYLERGRKNYRELDSVPRDGIDTLREWMMSALAYGATCVPRRGCFSVNCTVELAPHDDDVRALIGEHQKLLHSMYAETIRRGQRDGSISPGRDPLDSARWLDTVLSGIQVTLKSGLSANDGSSMVEFAIDALRP